MILKAESKDYFCSRRFSLLPLCTAVAVVPIAALTIKITASHSRKSKNSFKITIPVSAPTAGSKLTMILKVFMGKIRSEKISKVKGMVLESRAIPRPNNNTVRPLQ